MNDQLREGWVRTSIGECVDILDGKRVPINSDERAKRLGDVPYYGATGQVGWIDDYIFNEPLILLGEDGAPFLDKSKEIAYLIRGKSWVNNHAHVLRAVAGLTTNEFIKYSLDGFDFHDHVNGTTRLKLTQGAMVTIPVHLPPLAEQRRIVAAIEVLLADVNHSREHLTKVSRILKRARQSILASGCSGRLTEDWRTLGLSEETAEQSLKDVLSSSEQEVSTKQISGPTEIPSSWCWIRFGCLISSLRMGTTVPPSGEPTGFPVLRSSSVRPGVLDLEDVKYLNKESSGSEQNVIEEGDLLFTRLSGSLDYVANCARVPALNGKRIEYPDRLFRAKLRSPEWGAYIELCFGSPDLRSQLTVSSKSSAGHQRISMGALTEFLIPFPPIAEQTEILHRVRSLLELVDAVEFRVAAAANGADRITQSVLGKAFRGDLVPTEAELAKGEGCDYESASVLLERIQGNRQEETRPNPLTRGQGMRRVAGAGTVRPAGGRRYLREAKSKR